MVQQSLDDFSPNDSNTTNLFTVQNGYIQHPLIKSKTVSHRLFQRTIAIKSFCRNALVILPTGLGKTIIALLVTAETLVQTSGKVVFTAPTRPLVEQHFETFRTLLVDEIKMGMMIGSTPPDKRCEIYNESRILFPTPQCLSNDYENNRYSPDDVALLIVDEAHRTVGKYAYVNLCDRIGAPILGLTASPGGKKEKIKEVITHLKTEIIEARTRDDPDVLRYVKDINVEWLKVELTDEMKEIQSILEEYLHSQIQKLQKLGILSYGTIQKSSDGKGEIP